MNDYPPSIIGPEDEPDYPEPVKFRDHLTECPNCKKPVTDDMDNCPYCGDILFRYLKDGTFAPRRGPLVKIFAVLVVLMVLLAVIGLLLQIFGIL